MHSISREEKREMGLLEILGIVIIVMLLGIMILQIMGRRKSDISKISSLLKRTAEEQRNDVQNKLQVGQQSSLSVLV